MAMPPTDRIIVRTPPLVTARLEAQAARLGISRTAYASLLLGQASLTAEQAFSALPEALSAVALQIATADEEHDETAP